MKRKVNRRALGVYVLAIFVYLGLVLDLHQKLRIERVSARKALNFQNVAAREYHMNREEFDIWPIFYEFVKNQLDNGELDGDCLILVRKGDSLQFKKPHEILKERDREGLESLIRLVGKSRLIEFLQKEGIRVEGFEKVDEIAFQLGKNKEKGESKGLPGEVHKNEAHQVQDEWVMPDLRNLPMREAISRLSMFTSRIRVIGYGEVLDQDPKPSTRVYGEGDCVLYGIQN